VIRVDLWFERFGLLLVFFKNLLIVFQLQLEAQIRTDIWPTVTYKFYRRAKCCFILFHVISDNKGSGLHKRLITLDIPAPQCTRTEPRLRSEYALGYFIRWFGKKAQSRIRYFMF